MIYQSKDPNYKRGDRFKRRLPRFIGKIDDFHDLFQAEDKEFEIVDMRLKEFLDALYVHTIKNLEDPDIYLKKLEREWGVISDGSIDERIARILAKMRGRRTTTEHAILDVCKMYGHDARFIERYSEYGFTIETFGGIISIACLRAIKEIKPAHLSIGLKTKFKNEIYYGLYAQKIKHIKAFPYKPQDKTESLPIYYGGYATHKAVKRVAKMPDVWTIDDYNRFLEVKGEGVKELKYED
mgnify:CR=1 FL=1